jgi:hypothetical protein
VGGGPRLVVPFGDGLLVDVPVGACGWRVIGYGGGAVLVWVRSKQHRDPVCRYWVHERATQERHHH